MTGRSRPTTMHKGADFSHHNGHIDFGTVKRSGVEFIAIKATEGDDFVDPTFRDNQTRARAVGFRHLLFYHFLQPGTDAMSQARHFASTVGRLRPGEMIVVDVEAALVGGKDAWAGLSPDVSASIVIDCLTALSAANLGLARPVVYGSPGWLRGQFGKRLADIAKLAPLWAARYGPHLGDVSPWKKALIWQHSESGSVPGAGDNGGDDLDVWMDEGAWA